MSWEVRAGGVTLGRSEHLLAALSIDEEAYEIGIFDPRSPNVFTYDSWTTITILSKQGVKTDSIQYGGLLKLGEVLNLGDSYYRFEEISNNGDVVTLIKEKELEVKIGTQIGMVAPEFNAVTTSGDTITSTHLEDKLTIIANSCRCGGDKESARMYFEMEQAFGDSLNLLHVDSNIKHSDIGTHIDTGLAVNKDFYMNYRKEYCSRICYVIGPDRRIIDKFYITDWRSRLGDILR